MTQFHTIKHIDNSRLIRRISPERMREMVRLIALAGLLALMALVYAWQHFDSIQMGYQLEALKSQKAQATELSQELKIELAGLEAPSRIDEIAKNRLGLTAPVAGQVAPFNAPAEPVMAEMRRTGVGRSQ